MLSIDTEFIKNEKENVQKQDCGTNATKRLLGRLKQDYPRLPICIQADNLYETQPMMELCHKNGFRYILTHKESRQKNIGQSYQLFLKSGDAETITNIGAEKGRAVYVNHVEETVESENTANIFEYSYTEQQEDGKIKTTKFQWITDIELMKNNLEEMISSARGHYAALSCMESNAKGDKVEHKKYIFNVTGKFSRTQSNG